MTGAARNLRERSADFWRDLLYRWAWRWPIVVLLTRPFFLFFAFRFSKALAHGPRANARRLLGAEATPREVETLRRQIVRGAYTTIYELGCAVRSDSSDLDAWIEGIEGGERYRRARETKRGMIVVTAHLGPFEVAAKAITSIERGVHVLFREDARPGFERLRQTLRDNVGLHGESVDNGVATWARLRDALARDEVVLIQGDRVMPGQRGVEVPFLGGHMLMPTGAYRLAQTAGCPIIPIFAARTQLCRCRVWIGEPIEVGGGVVDASHSAMTAYARALEAFVKTYPAQWARFEPACVEDEAVLG